MGSYLGQNFLVNTKIKQYIADKVRSICRRNALETIIEIGPGKGAISKKIYQISSNFFVVEKDIRMKEYLKTFLISDQMYFDDVLRLDFSKILDLKGFNAKNTLIVGNLPYYITSPILRQLFANGEQKYFGGLFMIQDEVGQKIKTDAKKKSFLWWILNYAYDIFYCKKVAPQSFDPAPKVNSCLVELSPKQDIIDSDFNKLMMFLDLYSPFNRKMLGAIDKILKKHGSIDFEIPENLSKKRLEELSWDELKLIL